MILWSVTKLQADRFTHVTNTLQTVSLSFVLAQGPLNPILVLATCFQEENIEIDLCFKDFFKYQFFMPSF